MEYVGIGTKRKEGTGTLVSVKMDRQNIFFALARVGILPHITGPQSEMQPTAEQAEKLPEDRLHDYTCTYLKS
jgi:hypothetical protein